MSEKLDTLLKAMNEAQRDRLLNDIPTSKDEPYWPARDAYMKAYHEADKVHIPEEARIEEVIEETKTEETKTEEPKSGTKTAEEQLASLGIH